MSQRLQCFLDGVSLDSLDESIRLLDVREQPVLRLTTARRAEGGGSVLTDAARTALEVTISFGLYERSVLRRAALLEKVADWATGRTLTCTARPGRMLRVRCSGLPAMRSHLNWTEPLSLTLTAWAVPWWQDERPARIRQDSEETPEVEWYVPGTAPETPVSCRVTNLSDETLTELTLGCGETRAALDGLLLSAGDTVDLCVDADGMLSILDGSGGSVAKWRTADSDDLLLARCGARNTLRVEADTRVSALWQARGRYL